MPRNVPYQRNTQMIRHLSKRLSRNTLIPESYGIGIRCAGWAMHQKYQNGLPLNRQESEWKQLGVPLSRATLANWIIYCAENYLCHVYDYFHRQLRMRKYLRWQMKPRVQVLNEPGAQS